MRSRLALSLLALALTAAACNGDTSVFDLKVGDCFNDQADLTQTEVSAVPTVDCAEPHDNEIYFEYSMTGTIFPGETAILDEASTRCLTAFEPFVGISFADSILDIFPITPTAGSWAEGDRVVYCALYAFDLSKLTGSMRGTGR